MQQAILPQSQTNIDRIQPNHRHCLPEPKTEDNPPPPQRSRQLPPCVPDCSPDCPPQPAGSTHLETRCRQASSSDRQAQPSPSPPEQDRHRSERKRKHPLSSQAPAGFPPTVENGPLPLRCRSYTPTIKNPRNIIGNHAHPAEPHAHAARHNSQPTKLISIARHGLCTRALTVSVAAESIPQHRELIARTETADKNDIELPGNTTCLGANANRVHRLTASCFCATMPQHRRAVKA